MPNAVKYKTGNLTGSLQKGNVALGISGSLGPTSTTGWYNGPNPPTSGLYQIIETAASGDPDVYSPQNDAELIKFARWKGATGANTGSAAAVLAWIGTQTNLMAINFQYEGIITNGLVFNLDAGFVGSYPITGTNIYDLGSLGYNGVVTNGPTFSNNYLTFDGIDDYIEITNFPWSYSSLTVCTFIKPSTNASSGDNNIITIENSFEYRYNNIGGGNADMFFATNPWAWYGNGRITLGQWQMLTFRHDTTGGFGTLFSNST